jgi:aryl-alcohol dehydrogenase-like predicted oxidoreductase
MDYKNLGKTGLKVSRICLGAMNYGDPVTEAEAIKIVKDALSMGVNFFDTADGYGGGKSEEILGKALKGERQSVVIATKTGAPTGSRPNDSGLSRRHIMQAVEQSLKRLQTDYIDLYYAHFPDYETPLDETLRAFDDLVHQGKVRYIGCSNFPVWYITSALRISDVNHLARFDCVQPVYNLLTRDIEVELLPLCTNEGMGVCTYNPLAGEILTEKHVFGKPPAEGRFTHKILGKAYYERYWSSVNFQAADRLRKLAKARSCSLPQFSLAWILSNDIITSVLSGTTEIAQLKENLAAADIKLSQDEINVCDEVWQMFRPPRYHYAKTPASLKQIQSDLLKSK